MFIIGTNVLSAMMSSRPMPEVAAWIARQSPDSLFTASICRAEILSGIAVMPVGRRRLALESAALTMFERDFEGRTLPFDAEAAVSYAQLFAARRRAGRPTATADLIIAAIALTRGAGVVTRDTGGFEGCGLTLVDPWTAQ